ncbi:MAG TPA: hypothetical protein PLH31_11680, partial [Caulobacter sp.]|nr:hypothetical protein [Caulobacter sp.]
EGVIGSMAMRVFEATIASRLARPTRPLVAQTLIRQAPACADATPCRNYVGYATKTLRANSGRAHLRYGEILLALDEFCRILLR